MATLILVASPIIAWSVVLGLWLVLPFLGLELLAMSVALGVCMHRNRYREVIEITEKHVRAQFGMLGRGAGSTVEMPRHWTRVRLEVGLKRNDPTRLLLACSGQRVEIGRCLTDEERERLAVRLRELLKPVGHVSVATDRDPPAENLSLGDQ